MHCLKGRAQSHTIAERDGNMRLQKPPRPKLPKLQACNHEAVCAAGVPWHSALCKVEFWHIIVVPQELEVLALELGKISSGGGNDCQIPNGLRLVVPLGPKRNRREEGSALAHIGILVQELFVWKYLQPCRHTSRLESTRQRRRHVH